MSNSTTEDRLFTKADFDEAVAKWKESMAPRILHAAKDTAAEILEQFAATIKNADVDGVSGEAKVAAKAALAQAAGIARDLASTLRSSQPVQNQPAPSQPAPPHF